MDHSSASSETTHAPYDASPLNEKSYSSKESESPDKLEESRKEAGTHDVTMDFFDPEGINELERKLTRFSTRVSQIPSNHLDPSDDEFSLKHILKHNKHLLQEAGVQRRSTGVMFKDLSVTGAGTGIGYLTTIGGIFGAPVIALVDALKKKPAGDNSRKILKDFNGHVKPGEMLLVLGRPGAGCSTLLKVLANHRAGYKDIDGEVTFDGRSPETMKKHYGGETAYLPEDDVHFPNLTVAQTLDFAAQTRAPSKGTRPGGMTREEYAALVRDILAAVFGLRHTYNTKVGNDVIRGVSGGERKRVSIAETMTTRAKVTCHDNSTRGLDASTALEYIRALRIATDLTDIACIVSIYQAAESLYELFDKVCLISAGRQIYYGPASQAKQYFMDLGFEPQDRQTTPDFLVSVTDTLGRKLNKSFVDRGIKIPQSHDDLALAFRNSDIYQRNIKDASDYASKVHVPATDEHFAQSAKADKVKAQSPNSSFVISYWMQLKLAMKRRWQLTLGDLPTVGIMTFASIFQALIMGSVFLNVPYSTAGFFSRGGVIFFTVLFNSLQAMAEITNCYAQRPITIRQSRYSMVRPSTDALAQSIVELPGKILTIICFDLILYFMVGLQREAGKFFIFLLFSIIITVAMTSFFRMIASWTKAESMATTFAGLSVLIIVLYAGYAIPTPSEKVWWSWWGRISPVTYAFESLMVNEFRGLTVPCASIVPSGPSYVSAALANTACTTAGAIAGTDMVSGEVYLQESYEYRYDHLWRNLGIIIAFEIFFLFMTVLGSEFQQDASASGGMQIFKRGAVPPELKAAADGVVTEDLEAGVVDEAVADPAAADEAANHVIKSHDVFTWRDVCYDVDVKGGTRRLLNDVFGFVKPGTMTALMGESGAGKTTLLNVLAQRVTMGVVTGDFLVNSRPIPLSFQRQSGYAQQQDIHLATQTVREALVFSALLRQPASVPVKEKKAYVEEIIKLLEMEAYAEAIVGDVGIGLSVEQRKRLTIGVELAAKPALLIFLDEPTSGLDSQSAWSIISLLRKLADHGTAILCTIHQPSGELFQVFDRLLLLQKGGKTVYFGDLGPSSKTMIDYFESHTDLKCGADANPAEYILDAIGAGAGAKASQDWHQIFLESDLCKQGRRELEALHQEYGSRPPVQENEAEDKKTYAASTLTQIAVLTKRNFIDYYRNPTYLMAKIMLNLFAGFFLGSSFYKAPSTIAGLQVKLFAIFMSVVLAAPLAQQVQPQFIAYRTLYEARERPSKMYNMGVFGIAAMIVELPWNMLAGTILFLPWFFLVGFPTSPAVGGYMFFIYVFCFQMYYATFAQATAAVSPNATAASIIYSALFSFVIAFNGVLQPPSLMPYFWRSWMYHLTPFTYLIAGMLSNGLGNQPITCATKEYATITPPSGMSCGAYLNDYLTTAGGYLLDANATSDCQYCSYSNGNDYLATLETSYSQRWRNVGILFGYIAFNVLLVFVAIRLRMGSDKKAPKPKKAEQKVAEPASEGAANTITEARQD